MYFLYWFWMTVLLVSSVSYIYLASRLDSSDPRMGKNLFWFIVCSLSFMTAIWQTSQVDRSTKTIGLAIFGTTTAATLVSAHLRYKVVRQEEKESSRWL